MKTKLCLCIGLAVASGAWADTFTWKGTSGGSWNDAANMRGTGPSGCADLMRQF